MNNTGKMRREMSEFIVSQVIANGEVLILGSQKRQNYDNEMRQEIWSDLANQLNASFRANLDAEKVKQHFNNRRKSVMSRIREEFRAQAMELSPLEEKMEHLRRKRILTHDSDLRIVEFFLAKEEERSGTPNNLSNVPEYNTDPFNFLNGLIKTEQSLNGEADAEEAGCSTSSENNNEDSMEPTSSSIQVFERPEIDLKPQSHLLVDVSNKTELKRLLSVLIDNGFYRFTHVDDINSLMGLRENGTLVKQGLLKRKLNRISAHEPVAKKVANGKAVESTPSSSANNKDCEYLFSDITPSNILLEMAGLKEDESDDGHSKTSNNE